MAEEGVEYKRAAAGGSLAKLLLLLLLLLVAQREQMDEGDATFLYHVSIMTVSFDLHVFFPCHCPFFSPPPSHVLLLLLLFLCICIYIRHRIKRPASCQSSPPFQLDSFFWGKREAENISNTYRAWRPAGPVFPCSKQPFCVSWSPVTFSLSLLLLPFPPFVRSFVCCMRPSRAKSSKLFLPA